MAEKKKSRIVIIDDHVVVRQGLAQLLNNTSEFMVCGEASSPEEALAVIQHAQPDCAIVDLSLGHASGLDLIETIHARWERLAMLVLSMHDEAIYAERVLRAGARGYVMKREVGETLLEAIRCVLGGEIYVGQSMRTDIIKRLVGKKGDTGVAPLQSLTNRELEVFRLIGEGLGCGEIADKFCLSVKTIETYCARIKEKLHLHNVRDLTRQAVLWVEESRK